MYMSDAFFYKNMKGWKLPLNSLLEEGYFSELPPDWLVVVADIKDSTAAVGAGRHNDVNLVAAGCLIAALNIAKKYDVEIPFFFGGDGGTVILPPLILHEVLDALSGHNGNSNRNLGLQMHIGFISVKEIADSGHKLRICKMHVKNINKSIVLGDGLQYAERKIKIASEELSGEPDQAQPDLNGLECRWDKVGPPQDADEIVCLLVECRNVADQFKVYRDVLLKIEQLYGDIQSRHPLSAKRMTLLVSIAKLKKEMLIRYGKWRPSALATAWLQTAWVSATRKLSTTFFGFSWKKYLSEVIAHTDTLSLDGRLNTIITGNRAKRKELIHWLTEKEQNDELIFSYHISQESIITCYIEDRDEKHIHFLDGADGGYTEASKEFKRKLKELGVSSE